MKSRPPDMVGHEIRVVGYCRCSRFFPATSKRDKTTYCKNCGTPITIKIVDFPKEGSLSDRESADRKEIDSLKKRNEALDRENRILEARVENAEVIINDLRSKYSSISRTYDQVTDRLTEVQKQVEQNESLKEQLVDKDKEIDMWSSANASLRERYRKAEETAKDFQSEVALLQAEKTKRESVKIRELTDIFLEYMSGIYNASLDITDIQTLSQMIRARTDKVIMVAGGCGVDIVRHDRGSVLGDGRMDIDTMVTHEPELDNHVSKSRKFGCSFRNSAESEIPERITVHKYVPEKIICAELTVINPEKEVSDGSLH